MLIYVAEMGAEVTRRLDDGMIDVLAAFDKVRGRYETDVDEDLDMDGELSFEEVRRKDSMIVWERMSIFYGRDKG